MGLLSAYCQHAAPWNWLHISLASVRPPPFSYPIIYPRPDQRIQMAVFLGGLFNPCT